MGKKFDIELALRGKDEGATGLIERTTAKLRLMAKEERLSGESLLAGKLKSGAGVLDVLGNLAGASKFGLFAVVAEKGAEALTHMTEEAARLRRELAEGSISVEEMEVQLFKTVPLLGQAFSLGQAIREAATGELAETQRRYEMARIGGASFDYTRRVINEARVASREWTEEIRKLNQELALARAPEGSRPEISIEQEKENKLAELRKKYETDAKLKTDKGEAGELPQKQDALREAERQLQAEREHVQELHLKALGMQNEYRKGGGTVYSDSKSNIEDVNRAIHAYNEALDKSNKSGNQQRRDALANEVATLEKKRAELEAQYREAAGSKEAESANAVDNQRKKNLQKAVKDMNETRERTEARLKERRAEEERAVEETLAGQRRVSEAKSELAAQQMEADGDMMGAEIERLREHYKEKIEAAKDGERAILEQTEALQEEAIRRRYQNDEEAARKKARELQEAGGSQHRDPFRATLLNDRYLGLAAQQRDADKFAPSMDAKLGGILGEIQKLTRTGDPVRPRYTLRF